MYMMQLELFNVSEMGPGIRVNETMFNQPIIRLDQAQA